MPTKRIRRTANGRFRKRARKITRRRPLSRSRALTKRIKSVVLKTAETKTYGVCETVDNLGTCYWEPLNYVTPYTAGTGPSNEQFQTRFGQQYHLVGFRLKMAFSNYPAEGVASIKPLMVRVVIVEAYKEQATIKPTSLTPMFIDGQSERVDWADIGLTMASMCYKIDHKKYRTVKDQVFVLGNGSNSANGWAIKMLDWWVPIKKDINCDEMNTGDLQQDRCYYFGYWAYDPQLPNTELIPGPVRMSWAKKTYWKDP